MSCKCHWHTDGLWWVNRYACVRAGYGIPSPITHLQGHQPLLIDPTILVWQCTYTPSKTWWPTNKRQFERCQACLDEHGLSQLVRTWVAIGMFVWVFTHALTNQELLIPWGILQWPRSIDFGTKNFFFSISGSVLRSAWQKVIWQGTFAQETWTVAGSNKMVQQQPCSTVLLNAYDTVSSKQKFSGCQLWGSSFERNMSFVVWLFSAQPRQDNHE